MTVGALRKTTVAGAVLLAGALIAGLGVHLTRTQAQGRETLRDALGRRAALTARLIGSAFTASASSPQLGAQFGGGTDSLARAVRRYAAADGETRLAVLDGHGTV